MAADFAAAWDAALVDGWRRIEETAMERALAGETEVIERDGVTITRHRPCAPQLMIAMVDRAERARTAAKVAAASVNYQNVVRIRNEIRLLAELDPDDQTAYLAIMRKLDAKMGIRRVDADDADGDDDGDDAAGDDAATAGTGGGLAPDDAAVVVDADGVVMWDADAVAQACAEALASASADAPVLASVDAPTLASVDAPTMESADAVALDECDPPASPAKPVEDPETRQDCQAGERLHHGRRAVADPGMGRSAGGSANDHRPIGISGAGPPA